MRSHSIKSYPISVILDHVRVAAAGGPEKITLDGDLVGVSSVRLRTFAFKGTRCVRCGIRGSFFRKEFGRPGENPHLNLYAALPGSLEVLMTKDHIIPKSRGGPDYLRNMQTMCFRCNEAKADSVTSEARP